MKISARTLAIVLSLIWSSVTASCASKPCPLPPCPAPGGIDPKTCRCQTYTSAGMSASGTSGSIAGVGSPNAGASGAAPVAGSSNEIIDFPCGGTVCDGRSQICEHVVGGVAPGVDIYDCIPIPAACVHDDSCSCALAALMGRGADDCAIGSGYPSVHIDVP